MEAIKHFEVYLKGAEFKIETDHKALTFIQTMKRGSPKLMRWAAILQEHNCSLQYRPGPTNVVADTLSRIHEVERPDDQQQQVPHKENSESLHIPGATSLEVGGDVVLGLADM